MLPNEQPVSQVQVPFVSRGTDELRIVFADFNEKTTRPIVEIQSVEVFNLGAASHLWTRFPRLLVHTVQKFFLTAIVLPLISLGFALLFLTSQKRALAIIVAVPAYVMRFQSAFHTQYRYILPTYYFTFMLAAVALTWISKMLWQGAHRLAGSMKIFGIGETVVKSRDS